jgi:hypothetical protein
VFEKSGSHSSGVHVNSCFNDEKMDAEFQRGSEIIGDDERPWWPKEATNDEIAEAVHDLVMCDRRRDLRSIARKNGYKLWLS